MALENNVKCDYENCGQRYLAEPHNWWIVYLDSEKSEVCLTPLGEREYETIVRDGDNEDERHCCCLDHATKQAARFCEKFMAQPQAASESGAPRV